MQKKDRVATMVLGIIERVSVNKKRYAARFLSIILSTAIALTGVIGGAMLNTVPAMADADVNGVNYSRTYTAPEDAEILSELEAILLDFDIVTYKGEILHIEDFTEDYTAVILGRPGCGKTHRAYSAAQAARNAGKRVKIVYLAYDDMFSEFEEDASNDPETIWSDNYFENDDIFWEAIRTVGDEISREYALPETFVFDKSHRLTYFHCVSFETEDIYGTKVAENISGFRAAMGLTGVDDDDNYIQFYVKYGQTEARSMLTSLNKWRTSDDAWVWEENNTTKKYVNRAQPLIYDYGLEEAAMIRAAEIAVYYDHTRPNGDEPFTTFHKMNGSAGENIAFGYKSAEDVLMAWREDQENYSGQGHRRNMLETSFRYIGIGHVVVNGVDFWVQEFCSTPDLLVEVPANDSRELVNVWGTNYYLEVWMKDGDEMSMEEGSVFDLDRVEFLVTSEINKEYDLYVKLEGLDVSWSVESWSIEDDDCAVIENGKLIAKKAGSVRVVAEFPYLSEDNKVDMIFLNILKKPGVVIPRAKISSLKSKKGGVAVVKWNALSEVDGYQIAYAKKNSFQGAKKKNVPYIRNGITLKNLTKGKTYYIRVRGYVKTDDGRKYGKWSNKKKVKIKK